jgi:hypothetical protein
MCPPLPVVHCCASPTQLLERKLDRAQKRLQDAEGGGVPSPASTQRDRLPSVSGGAPSVSRVAAATASVSMRGGGGRAGGTPSGSAVSSGTPQGGLSSAVPGGAYSAAARWRAVLPPAACLLR